MATNKRASEETVFRQRQLSQRIQNFVVLWLDANIDESTREFKEPLAQLRESVGTSIQIFKDANDCIEEIQDTMNQKVLLIVSGYVGQNIVPQIHELPQVESIYVLCGKKSVHEEWANKISKVKAVCTDIKSIREGLKQDRQQCHKTTMPMSFQSDPLFMYTQLVKEAILQIDYDDVESIKQLAEFCRKKGGFNVSDIQKFETEYVKENAIWWYTAPYFLYPMLNCALREFDVEILMKMGFFMGHLHRQMQKVSEEQYADPQSLQIMGKKQFELYRGQGLPKEKFEKLKRSEGGLMSFNNFLSTSYKKNISLAFAQQSALSQDTVGILFVMQIDADLCKESNIPFVEITDKLGYYGEGEAEILFTTHTLFKIEKVQPIADPHTNRLYQVNLTVASPDTHELKEVADSLDQEIGYRRGFARLAAIFLKSGLSEQAKDIYHALLEKATTDEDIADINYQLGWVYKNMGEYEKAIHYYEEYYKIKRKTVSAEDSVFANYYNNIGGVYYYMGDYSNALSSHQQSLEIRKQVLPPNHPDLAKSYWGIAMVYDKMGEYKKSLEFYDKMLQIQKQVLPPNHPDLATSYNNIGLVYNNMGDYSKALSSYQHSLEIRKQVLPPNHPDFAQSYHNIGWVYNNMGDYSKALSSYQHSLEIWKQVLPPNHPYLATSYHNFGLVYHNMGDYSKALSSYQQSLEIKKQVLPPNHPDLAASYNNIGMVYENTKEYTKALSYYEKALQIWQTSLPAEHPHIALVKRNIERVKNKM